MRTLCAPEDFGQELEQVRSRKPGKGERSGDGAFWRSGDRLRPGRRTAGASVRAGRMEDRYCREQACGWQLHQRRVYADENDGGQRARRLPGAARV